MTVESAQTGSNRGERDIPQVSLGSWAFSFGPYENKPWSFDEFVTFSRNADYDGVEINGFRPHPHDADYSSDDARNLGRRLRSLGLGVSGYAPDLRSTPPGEAAERDYLARIASISQFCVNADIKTVRVDTIVPPSGPTSVSESLAEKRLIRTWRESADLLADAEIQLVWEFEPGFWINRPSRIVEVLGEVDHPNFGLLFDTSHAHTLARYGRRQGTNPEILSDGAVGFATMVAPWVRHLHLIDSDGSLHDEDTSVHMPFGLGEIDFAAVLQALGGHASNLAWWTIDYCFWPTTDVDAISGPSFVRKLRDDFMAMQRPTE